MKKSIFKKLGGLFLGLAMGLGVATGLAANLNAVSESKAAYSGSSPWSYTFKSGDITTSAQSSKTLNNVSWTIGGATYVNFDSTKGIQIGSSGNPQKNDWTLSADIGQFGTSIQIDKVEVNISTASSGGIAWTLYAGDSSNNDSTSGSAGATTSVTTKTLTVDSSKSITSGEVKITLNSNSKAKAIYLNSINVYFSTVSVTTYQVTYKANGGTGTDETRDVKKINDFMFTAPDGKEFDSWNTNPNGTGSKYLPGDSVSSNLTLYAIYKDKVDSTFDLTIQSYTKSDGTATWSDGITTIVSSGNNATNYLPSSSNTYTHTRIYSGGTQSYSVASGYRIVSLIITTTSETNAGYLKNGTWTNATAEKNGSVVTVTPSTNSVTTITSSVSSNTQLTEFKLIWEKMITHTVTISGGAESIYVGKTTTFTASCDQTDSITWNSSNTSIATVNNGVVKGISAGEVTITAKCEAGGEATKTVTVLNDVKTLQSISVSGGKSTFTKGDSFATTGLVVTGTYSHTNGDGNSQEQITTGITTSPSVGTELNTVGPQTVTVNAGGKSTTYSITVNYAAVESVELDYEEGTLGKGGEATLPGANVLPENANQGVSWTEHADNATSGISYSYDSSTLKVTVSTDNSVAGTLTFIATATGDSSKTATVVYTVQAAQIANITGVTASATGEIVAKQYVGDAFNAQGFSFAPTWSEGDHDVVEITANDISWNALVAGSNPTGTYSCADGDFTVTIEGVTVVNDTLVSIAFSEGCDMTKKSYKVGDSWDFSGLSIVGTMDSGKTTSAISSNVTFSSNDAVATTTTSITVTASYQGLTTATAKTITGIEVIEVKMTSLTVNYTGGQPVLGTDFVFAGTIKGNMSNGTQQDVSVSDVDFEVNKFITTEQTVTVTHKITHATGTFNVTYKTKDITYTTSWTRCTSTTDIVSGATYILGYEATANSGTIIPMNNTNDSNYMNSGTSSGNTGTITMSSVTATSDYEVQLISSTEVSGAYYVKCGDSYISNKNVKNSCTLETETAKTTSFGITVGSNDVFTFKIAENASYHTLSYNTSSPRFACYGGTMKNLVVYKKVQTPSGTADIIKLNAALKSGKTFNEGATISASDFDCSTLDNLNQTKTVTATSVSPTNLVAGENTITVYYNTWNTTVTVNAAEVAHLDHIEVVDGTGTRSFTRGTSFNSTGLKIKAYYSNTDKTKFPDRELTSGFTVTPLTSAQMNVADTYDVSVSYTENGVTKSTTYSVTVTPKVSTSVTIAGNGIEGSNGAYTLASGVTNEVELTLGCNGDETVEFVQGDQNVVTFANGKLSVNSSTKTTEQITVSFKAGSATATLTVNISAEEGIQLISNDEIVAYVGSSFSYDINIQLNNVESATWTLPQGDFVIESETEDNTGLVGTIYFTDEVSDTLTFSVLTGKGETLSVDIEVLAVNDDIKSISASLKSGVTYSAGKGQTFSNDDLIVKCVRDSGAKGTLNSNEFTVSGLPEGSFNRVASYELTVTSTENTDATSVLTINVGMPSDLNLNFVTSAQVTEDGETYWKKVTDLSTISTSKKYAFILEDGANSKIFNGVDASTDDNAETPVGYINTSVSNGNATYTEGSPYLTINYDSSNATASIKCVGGSETLAGKYIYGKSNNNSITCGSTETFMSFVMEGDDNHIIATSNSTSFRFNATANNNRFRFYKTSTTGNAYSYPCLYELATKPGDSHLEYSNVNETTDTANKYDFAKLYNFIALANETYADICGSEGNNQKPDLTTWRSVLESAEYSALVADTNSYNLLKSAICGEGAYGSNGVYVASGDKQSSDMVIEFLQKYDRVVSNYGTDSDYNYLGRNVTKSGSRINPIMSFKDVEPTTWIIAVVGVAGLSAIGGYFFYRKRKEI